MIKFGFLSRGGVLSALLRRTICHPTRKSKEGLNFYKLSTQWTQAVYFCTEIGKPTEVSNLETDISPTVEKETSLLPKYPPPPEGKLNLIRNGDVIHVTPKEMYDKLRQLPSEYVLETFATNLALMDKIHFAISLKRLNAVIHRLPVASRDQYVENLLKDDRFQVLLAVITRKGRFYSADVQFNILRSLCEFGLSTDHPSVKVFLQLLRRNINGLFLDQLIQVFNIIDLLDDCDEKVYIKHAVEQLVTLRKDEINYLDDYEAALLLDFFPNLLQRSQKLFLLNKIRSENYTSKLDHQYSHLLLRMFAKSLQSEHPIVDQVMLNRVVSACHRLRGRYSITELIDIVSRMKQLRMYRQQMFDDIGHVICDKSHVLFNSSITNKIQLLHELCQCSHFHVDLCQNIECNIDPDELRFEELHQFLSLCWSYNYEFSDEELLKECVAVMLRKLDRMSLDLYLELCLMLMTFDLQLPENLSDVEMVTSSEYSRKMSAERAGSHSKQDKLTVLMPPKEQDTGMFTAQYTSCWSVSRQEIINLIREGWSPLPKTIETISNNIGVNSIYNKVNIQEFDLYLMSAASEYKIETNYTLDNGLTVDFVILKKNNNRQSGDIMTSQHEQRLALKLLPPCVSIRNQLGLKQPASLYMSLVQSKGYKTLVVTTHGWRAVPHAERTSYLNWKIDAAFSDKTDNNLLII